MLAARPYSSADPGSPAPPRPLVSVIMPAYNAQSTVVAALRSALSQTYENIEVIVVDDGSTDGTVDAVAALASGEPRLRLIRAEHGGQARARNIAIEQSTGEYVAPLDADDLWHPQKIERQIEAALSAPERPGLVNTFHYRIDEADRILSAPEALTCRGMAFHRLYYRNFVGTGSAPLLLRTALLEVGGYQHAGNSEDALVQLRIARRYRIASVSERLVGYRVTTGSLTQDVEGAFDRWMQTRDMFEAEWRDLPPYLRRWTRASRWLLFAEAMALQRRNLAALRAVGHAVRLDPDRTLRVLLYRVARTIVKNVRGRSRLPADRSFHAPPEFHVRDADPDALPWLAARLQAFEARRMARLAKLDRRLGRETIGPDVDETPLQELELDDRNGQVGRDFIARPGAR